MHAKVILKISLYVAPIIALVLVAMLLRRLVPEEIALGIGWLGMLFVSYPLMRYFSGQHLTFTRWAIFSMLGAIAGAVVLHYL
jgi:positive regulator of sigma E activity